MIRYLLMLIKGSIPDSITQLYGLARLDLSENNLIGTFESLCLFCMIVNSNLGSLPAGLDNLVSLEDFSVSNNLLTGSFDKDIYSVIANVC